MPSGRAVPSANLRRGWVVCIQKGLERWMPSHRARSSPSHNGEKKEKAREVGMTALKERKEINSSKKSADGIFECLFLFQNIPPGTAILVYFIYYLLLDKFIWLPNTHRGASRWLTTLEEEQQVKLEVIFTMCLQPFLWRWALREELLWLVRRCRPGPGEMVYDR